MKRSKAKAAVTAAMRAKGFATDREVAEAARLERSRVTKARLAIGNVSLTDSLALERVLWPHLRAEQLALKPRSRHELRELRERLRSVTVSAA